MNGILAQADADMDALVGKHCPSAGENERMILCGAWMGVRGLIAGVDEGKTVADKLRVVARRGRDAQGLLDAWLWR